MADGLTHFNYLKKGWYLAIPVAIGVGFILYNSDILRFFLFFIFSLWNYLLSYIIDPDLDLYSLSSSEGRALRLKKIFWPLGLLGIFFVMYSFLYAAIINSLGKGHRSILSHGIFIGTIGRMIFFNLPFAITLTLFGMYAKINYGWTDLYFEYYMDMWFAPYIISQLCMWFISDGIHIFFDTEYAKRFYKIQESTKTKLEKEIEYEQPNFTSDSKSKVRRKIKRKVS